MEVSGANNLHVATMKKNGEAYELLGELLGECSACDLHLALSLVTKLRDFGLAAPVDTVVLQPRNLLQKRLRQRQRSQLAFGGWPNKWEAALEHGKGDDGRPAVGCWNNLPQDLLLRVTRSLECDDIQVLGCTCAAWKTAISTNMHDVSFVWAGRRQLDKAGATPLIQRAVGGAAVIYSDLHTVSLQRCELLASDALARLAQASCRNLKALDLSGCKSVADVGVMAVAEHCPLLEDLQLASCSRLTDCSFVALGSFSRGLRCLNACGCEQLTDLGLRCLSQGARGLKQVNVGWCEALTEEGIQALATNCPQLESVDLCGCLQVGDRGISALASGCRGLQSLGLHCCRRLTDASQLCIAAHLHGLTRLNISGCRALTPAAVQEVVDSNPGLHTCGGLSRNVIVAGCLNLLAVSCSCPSSPTFW